MKNCKSLIKDMKQKLLSWAIDQKIIRVLRKFLNSEWRLHFPRTLTKLTNDTTLSSRPSIQDERTNELSSEWDQNIQLALEIFSLLKDFSQDQRLINCVFCKYQTQKNILQALINKLVFKIEEPWLDCDQNKQSLLKL